MKNFFIFSFYIYLIIIIFLNTIPTSQIDRSITAYSLFLHFLEFLILGILILLSSVKWLAGIIISLLAEIIQFFLPYRNFSLIDVSFNLAGFVMGFFALYAIRLISLNSKKTK